MFFFQIFVIVLTLALFSLLTIILFGKFNRELKFVLLPVAPLLVFCVGFALRLTGELPIVNLGFFLTEFSGLYVSVVFAVCLLLGQMKYWEK